MNLRARVRRIHNDEQGFAIIIAVALMTMVTIISIGLMTLASGESSKSRRDQAADGSYQAAEAGTDAYLSDLTEASGVAFPTAYIAKGEATRTDTQHQRDASERLQRARRQGRAHLHLRRVQLHDPGHVEVQRVTRERQGLVHGRGHGLPVPHPGPPAGSGWPPAWAA